MKTIAGTTRATSLGQAHPVVSRASTKALGSDGGKTAAQMTADHAAWRDDQPILTLCGFCDWTFKGTAAEGRDAAAAHRSHKHPDAKPVRRRRKGLTLAHLRDNDKHAQAEALAEAARRRRTTHADGGRGALERMDDGLPQKPARELALDDDAGSRSSASSSSAVLEPEALAAGRVAGASTNPYGLKRFGRGYIWTKDAALQAVRDFAEREGRAPSLSDVKKQPIGTLPSANSAAALLGSWPDLIEQAGFGRPQSGSHGKDSRVGDAQREILELLADGPMRVRDIADRRGVKIETAYGALMLLVSKELAVRVSRGMYALPGHEAACSEREPQAEDSPRGADGASIASAQPLPSAAPSRSEDAHLVLVASALDRIADGFRALAQLAAERAVEQTELAA